MLECHAQNVILKHSDYITVKYFFYLACMIIHAKALHVSTSLKYDTKIIYSVMLDFKYNCAQTYPG